MSAPPATCCCAAACREATCAISWPSTFASSSSDAVSASAPREMYTRPPGSAKALGDALVGDLELVVVPEARRVAGQPRADGLHVGAQRRVLDQPDRGLDLLRALAARVALGLRR